MKRRTFLSAVAAAPIIIPSTVFGANKKLNIAFIGMGGQIQGHVKNALKLGHNVVAFCDVDLNQIAKSQARHEAQAGKVKTYADYRRDSTDNNTIRLWGADSGNELITIAGQEYEGFYFRSVAFSPDGKRIAADSLDGIDGKITIYDIASPEEVEAKLLAEEEGRSWVRSDISE